MNTLRGSIHSRANGRFTVVTEPINQPDGTKRRVSLGTFATQEAARQRLVAYNAEPRTGPWAEDALSKEATELSEWLALWLDRLEMRHHAGALARRTLDDYRTSVTRYLDPMLGRYRIRDLDADRLERFQLEMKGRGLSDRTVLKVWRALRKSLQDARLGKNPCDAANTPRVRDQRNIVRPTTADVLEFVDHVSNCDRKAGLRLAVLWRLVVATGIRRGEACGLAWDDVDLGAGLMTISRSMGVDHGELFLKSPKSAAGHRTIGLDPVTVEALRSHQHVQQQEVAGAGRRYEAFPLDVDLVFRGETDGRPVHPSNMSWSFRNEWRHAELRPGVTLHGLRHAHGSALLLAGLPAVQVAARLGHAPHVLMSIYAGELDSAERQQVMAQAAATLYG